MRSGIFRSSSTLKQTETPLPSGAGFSPLLLQFICSLFAIGSSTPPGIRKVSVSRSVVGQWAPAVNVLLILFSGKRAEFSDPGVTKGFGR